MENEPVVLDTMSKSKDITALVRRRLLPYFNDKLPPAFGRPARRMVAERLLADGDVPEGVVDAALLRGCELMIGHLEGGGKAQFPESLFSSFCFLAVEESRGERARQDTVEIMRLLEGEVALADSPLRENTKILGTVRQAFALLPERLSGFLRLDLLEHRSEEEIREEFGLSDREEYLQLKLHSLAALRRAIERLLH